MVNTTTVWMKIFLAKISCMVMIFFSFLPLADAKVPSDRNDSTLCNQSAMRHLDKCSDAAEARKKPADRQTASDRVRISKEACLRICSLPPDLLGCIEDQVPFPLANSMIALSYNPHGRTKKGTLVDLCSGE